LTRAASTAIYESVRTLELVARHNVAGALQGDYVTAFKGSGLLFEEPRRYVAGDPVRTIDWNITARTGEPYVRVHREERQREVALLLDVSPSMHLGYQRRTKIETAIELAATVATSSVGGGDRLSLITFADRVLDRVPARGGRGQLWRVLSSLVSAAQPWERAVALSDPREAIHELEGRRSGPLVVFLVTDCVDRDVPEDLRYLRPRHDVSLLQVHEPFESAPTRHLRLPLVSPEGPVSSRTSHPGSEGRYAPDSSALALECARLGIAFTSVTTGASVPRALADHFHRKQHSRSR